MRKIIRKAGVILTLTALLCALLGTGLRAEELVWDEAVPETEEELNQMDFSQIVDGDWDSQELLQEYFERKLAESFSAYDDLICEDGAELYSSDFYAGRLSTVERAMYDAIKEMASAAASGDSRETICYVSISKTLGKTYWTAEDLGISELTADGISLTEEAIAALQSLVDYDPATVIRAALRDCPYEFYWCENFYLYGKGESSYKLKAVENEADGETTWSAYFSTDNLQVRFPVSSNYRLTSGKTYQTIRNGGSYTYYTQVDATKTILPLAAAENAAAIVADAADLSDYEKLEYYMQQICELNVYNSNAAASSSAYPNRDPWQLIYVFDGNPDTNVVCEGYAKAFQYLCECTTFTDSEISVITVTGELHQGTRNLGGHMWNIIHMGDGCNYMVDLTNCDGNPVRDWLFITSPAEGSVDTSYTFRSNSSELTYVYYDETRKLCSESELTLALNTTYDPAHTHHYVLQETIQAGCETGGYSTYKCDGCESRYKSDFTDSVGHDYQETSRKEAKCTTSGSIGYECSVCHETKSETIRALGHDYIYQETVRPTCTERGYDVYKCSRCEADKKDNYTDVLQADVTYRTHVQTYGNQAAVSNGAVSGTYGESKRLEAIWIDLQTNADLNIRYTTHVQTYGWLSEAANGSMSGTSGESKRLEAIMIDLYGNDAELFDVYYRVHAQSYGWFGWAKNGEPAGTAGYSKRLEGIQIVVVPKGTFDQSLYADVQGIVYAGTKAYISTSSSVPQMEKLQTVKYRTHVQTYGWQQRVTDGKVSGTIGEGKRLEAIEIALNGFPYSGDVEYQTHVQTYGWLNWAKNGALSGTSGESKRLEAIRIRLTGDMAEHYDIYYRVHAQSYGWLGWAKNGEEAGTAGFGYRLEAIQIVLVERGTDAPGSVGGITSARAESYVAR